MSHNLDVLKVRELIEEDRPTSLNEFVDLAAQRLNISISRSTAQRFLCNNGLKLPKKWMSDAELENATRLAVSSLGGYYGRKTMKGALASHGINASEKRIGKTLRAINPENHIRRALNTHRLLNPRRYKAPHFGYNLHLDQNEKLVDFGCVVVLGVDGHSNFLVAGNREHIL